MSEEHQQWIAVIKYGDPNTHESLKTSMGVFESKEQAEDWAHNIYEGTNFIVDVLPLNDFTKIN
jgi:hypothetical protein|tara:strand:+ start:472 stop:663 length:192 start_codon:yes stop_codon:yes gene_type:complete